MAIEYNGTSDCDSGRTVAAVTTVSITRAWCGPRIPLRSKEQTKPAVIPCTFTRRLFLRPSSNLAGSNEKSFRSALLLFLSSLSRENYESWFSNHDSRFAPSSPPPLSHLPPLPHTSPLPRCFSPASRTLSRLQVREGGSA